MYLTQVLTDIKKESAPPKNLHAEHLFKLNEAVFNLPEEDTVDSKLAMKLFQTVKQIRTAYQSGKFDNADSNFFYDYLALLGTMQNQHFFTQPQTEKMLSWIKEVVDDSPGGSSGPGPSNAALSALEAENERLRKKLAKFEELEGAVEAIRSFDMGKKAKGKAKAQAEPVSGKGKGKAAVVEELPAAKGKGGKGKGKGKGKVDDDDDEEVPAKGKGKGVAKGSPKGKGKGKSSPEPVEEAPPLRKGKGKGPEPKGKGKGKGKSIPDDDDVPPLRASKGKGKGASKGEAKGKGKSGGGKGKGGGAESKWKAKA